MMYGGYKGMNEEPKISESPMNPMLPQRVAEESSMYSQDDVLMDAPEGVIGLMREAINCYAHGVSFHRYSSCAAHMIGLQGFKRVHRYHSRKDNETMMKLQHYCIDMFSEMIEPTWDYVIPRFSNTENMLKSYLEYESSTYEKLCKIHNKLIMLNYVNEACLVKEGIQDTKDEIYKVRRHIQDFSNAEYMWHHIRYIDMRLHDKYKEKEKEECGFED